MLFGSWVRSGGVGGVRVHGGGVEGGGRHCVDAQIPSLSLIQRLIRRCCCTRAASQIGRVYMLEACLCRHSDSDRRLLSIPSRYWEDVLLVDVSV